MVLAEHCSLTSQFSSTEYAHGRGEWDVHAAWDAAHTHDDESNDATTDDDEPAISTCAGTSFFYCLDYFVKEKAQLTHEDGIIECEKCLDCIVWNIASSTMPLVNQIGVGYKSYSKLAKKNNYAR